MIYIVTIGQESYFTRDAEAAGDAAEDNAGEIQVFETMTDALEQFHYVKAIRALDEKYSKAE